MLPQLRPAPRVGQSMPLPEGRYRVSYRLRSGWPPNQPGIAPCGGTLAPAAGGGTTHASSSSWLPTRQGAPVRQTREPLQEPLQCPRFEFCKCFVIYGVGGGIRTLGHRNHNPALYQLSYTHRKGPFNSIKELRKAAIPGDLAIWWRGRSPFVVRFFASWQAVSYSPACFHSASTRRFTSGDISIMPGQGRVKPSPGHLRVASTPILEP